VTSDELTDMERRELVRVIDSLEQGARAE